MFNISYFWVGVCIIIFIICIALLIFAPKSINYYSPDIYPILEYINDNNLEIIKEDLNKIKESKDWVLWPDKQYVKGGYKIYPMYIFNVKNSNHIKECNSTYTLIHNTPDIKTLTFLHLSPNSSLNKQTGWCDLSNTTLRCLFILESPAVTKIDKCGIWVNGESKKLIKNNIIIFDSSKEHSIYNETNEHVYILLLDVKRPRKLPDGTSTRDYTDDVYSLMVDAN